MIANAASTANATNGKTASAVLTGWRRRTNCSRRMPPGVVSAMFCSSACAWRWAFTASLPAHARCGEGRTVDTRRRTRGAWRRRIPLTGRGRGCAPPNPPQATLRSARRLRRRWVIRYFRVVRSWNVLRSVKPVFLKVDATLDRARNRVVLHRIGEVLGIAAVAVFGFRDGVLHLVLAYARVQVVRVAGEHVDEGGVHGRNPSTRNASTSTVVAIA